MATPTLGQWVEMTHVTQQQQRFLLSELNTTNLAFYLPFFFLIDLYWSIIASQYRVSFCCTTK